jgi:chromosome segregation ATPase
MSWLTEFAGKAESFLNKIDQTTATALSPNEANDARHERQTYEVHVDPQRPSSDFVSTPKESRRVHESNDRERRKPIKLNGTKLNLKSKAKDEQLMNFLNQDISSSSLEIITESETDPAQCKESAVDSIEDSIVNDNDPGELSGPVGSVDESQTRLEALTRKVKRLEDDGRKAEAKVKSLTEAIKKETNQLKQMQENERLLVVAMSEKNELLQSFKEQLSDKENEMKRLRQRCRTLKVSKETNELTSKDATKGDSSEEAKVLQKMVEQQQEHEQTVQSLQLQLQQYQEQTQHQTETIQKYERVLKDENLAAESKLSVARTDIARLEDKLRQLSEELAICQIQYEQVQEDSERMKNHLTASNAAAATTEQELREYKARAAKILLDKDAEIKRLIHNQSQSMRSNEIDGNESLIAAEQSQKSSSEDDELIMLRSQCDHLINELQLIRDQNTQLKVHLDRVSIDELPAARAQIQRYDKEQSQTELEMTRLRAEVQSSSDELRSVHDNLERTRADLSERLRQRDEEIERLQRMLIGQQTDRSPPPVNGLESYEKRVKSLTESLVEKQTLVEQLYRENSQMQLQLHDSNQKYSSLQDQMRSQSDANWNGFVSNGIIVERFSATSRSSSLNAYEGRLPRKVKRAYNQLETIR